ncbi:MAG: hypothetical protein AAGD11_12005 [Planctomycetota bacterium]
MRSLLFGFLALARLLSANVAADEAKYLLEAKLVPGDTTEVSVALKLGGEMLLTNEDGEQQLPMDVEGQLRYTEQMVTWSDDSSQPARSLRDYTLAEAKIQIEKGGLRRELPSAKRSIAAELRNGRSALASVDKPLTRDQFDLINVVGNTLALNRLLPGNELAEGASWDHDAATIGALLGMDNVAVCEVSSMITGCEHRQVQIRMAGTVHGTIDGAPTEMDLRAAYLFHQQRARITKFNLAIKEKRTASQLVPGLDVVAKVSVKIKPSDDIPEKAAAATLADVDQPLPSVLSYEAPERGYRFFHDAAWYVIAEQSDRVSLRSLQNGSVTAHCSLTTLPTRSEGRETTLEEFERDVREMLGDHLESVSASTQWKTALGHDCLGIVAQGATEGIPIEWRYYLISSPTMPRVSLSVTVEQAQLERFADADRQIVDSLELVEQTISKTAKQSLTKRSRK